MAETRKLHRASQLISALVCTWTAIGCGSNAAKVVKADKPRADEPAVANDPVAKTQPASSQPSAASTVVSAPEPAPAAKGPRWTKAQIDKVKLGMSPSQVKGILGSATIETSSGKALNVQWAELDSQQAIHIVFENDKAIQKTSAGLGPIKEKLTQANLDKVSTGMPEAKVFEILGPGGSESETAGQKAITWEGNGKQVLVQIEKGKVVNKMVFQTN